MNNLTLLTFTGIAAFVVACSGTPPEPTASSASNLGASGAAAEAGGRGAGQGSDHGRACMPLDGGRSPCARGDGGDDENEVDDEEGGTDDQEEEGGDHRGGDAGRS